MINIAFYYMVAKRNQLTVQTRAVGIQKDLYSQGFRGRV